MNKDGLDVPTPEQEAAQERQSHDAFDDIAQQLARYGAAMTR